MNASSYSECVCGFLVSKVDQLCGVVWSSGQHEVLPRRAPRYAGGLLGLNVLDLSHRVGRLEIPQPDASICMSRAQHARALANHGHGIARRIAKHRAHAVALAEVPHLTHPHTICHELSKARRSVGQSAEVYLNRPVVRPCDDLFGACKGGAHDLHPTCAGQRGDARLGGQADVVERGDCVPLTHGLSAYA
jgi:hypothetical protein